VILEATSPTFARGRSLSSQARQEADTRMAFRGVPQATDRADLIAFLKSLKQRGAASL